MTTRRLRQWLLTGLLAPTVSGCAGLEPVMYSGLASSPQLVTNTDDEAGRHPYAYASSADFSKYNKIMIEKVDIYRGPDQQFGEISDEDKLELATDLQSEFTEKLRPRFEVTNTPSPKTLRLKLTLTGVKTTPPVLGTLSHFDMAGGLYNGVQTIRGKEGLMSGSVIYAVEIYDSMTGTLLKAYIAKQYPSPMNIAASFGSLDASKVGIAKGAEDLLAQFQ